jgi:hypothetical protein
MDFNFTDDQEQLRDAVRKWVDKGYDFERRRGIEAKAAVSRARPGTNSPSWAWAACTSARKTAAWAWARSRAWS